MRYKNNILYTDLKEVLFDFPIKQVAKYRNLYIVVISPLEELEYPSNIFGVNEEGDIVWKIKSFNHEQIIFNKIEINHEKEKLYGYDINHFKYIIDIETGEIISGKLRPLDDEDKKITKEKTSKMDIKKIEKTSINLLKNSKVLTLLLFIGFFVFMCFISKNVKIKTLKTTIEQQETYIQTLETTLINQEQVILQKEAQLKEYETYISQINKNFTGNNNYSSSNINTTEESIPSKNENKTTQTRENKVEGGISTVVDFIDTLVNNVSTGTPITTEDLKEMTKEVTEGYRVTQYVDGQRIKVSLDGQEEFVVKLISVSNCSISTLEKLIPIGTQIYLETDSKKYNDEGELLAYVWITSPDEDNIKSMVNYAILKSKNGTFTNESPNIKYNRHFF